MSELRQRAAGTAVAPRATDLKQQIKQMEAQFQLAMPRGMEAGQLVRDAMTVLSANPALANVDGRSVLGGLMTCSQLGLRPGVLGQAWLIPFKGKAQLIIGYQGLLVLAQRSNDIASISARMVHANDFLDVEYGLDEKLVHKPLMSGDRGPITGYYCVVKSKAGGTYWEYMTRSDAETHRDKFAMSKRDGKVFGVWADHFDAMALKTVVIRTLKLAPRNTQIQNAINVDGAVRVDVTPNTEITDVSALPTDDDTVDGVIDGEPDGWAAQP